MKKAEFCHFWSQMVQNDAHGNLAIGHVQFLYGNPTLTQIG